MLRAALAAAAVAAALVPGAASAAIHPSCTGEKLDVDVLGLVGVDDPTSGNGIVGVCVKANFVGVMVNRDGGTCVAVIVNDDHIGC
jgi:hypothetical protein